MTPYPSPSRSITPGRKPSTSTSAPLVSLSNASRPGGFLMFMATLFFPALTLAKNSPDRELGKCRAGSPRPGCSIFVTVAPNSHNICVARAPGNSRVRSSTLTEGWDNGADEDSLIVGVWTPETSLVPLQAAKLVEIYIAPAKHCNDLR